MNTNQYLRERVVSPLLLTVVAGGLIATVIINLSRVFIAIGAGVGIYISSAITLVILFVAIWAATRPRLSAQAGMFMLAFAAIGSIVAGSISWDKSNAHGEEGEAAIAYASVLEVSAANLVFDPEAIEAEVSLEVPGVHFVLTSVDATHNIQIEGVGEGVVVEAGLGGTAEGTIAVPAGSYTFFCAVSGHRAAGMEGQLVVTEGTGLVPVGGVVAGEGEAPAGEAPHGG